jgi:hypothetical protein
VQLATAAEYTRAVGSAEVRLTEDARRELRRGDALVFDWHPLAICSAAAGEMSLRCTTLTEVERSGALVPLADEETPVFANRRAYAHLAGHDIEVDCRRRLGLRHFTSSFPPDFGLRLVLGRPADPVSGSAK